MNFGAHNKFVTKWLEKLQKENEDTAPIAGPVAAEAAHPLPSQLLNRE